MQEGVWHSTPENRAALLGSKDVVSECESCHLKKAFGSSATYMTPQGRLASKRNPLIYFGRGIQPMLEELGEPA